MVESTMTSKLEEVKSLFEIPDKYLCPRQFDIQIRVETVQQFTENLPVNRVLDIGCGDGSISLPLLPRCSELTLLDLSSRMLDLARKKIPSDRLNDVDLINGSFIGSNLSAAIF